MVDDEDKDISAYDTPGEICIKYEPPLILSRGTQLLTLICRGPTIVKGYYKDPAANATAYDSDGFYHTGDIAICDSKTKKWYIIDRKKEIIKVRGFQVAPPELEGILLSHPHIVDAAVIGVVHEKHGSELPRAYVVRRPGNDGKKLAENDVKEWVNGKVASYKKLEGGVVFVDAIPKNASGKILKRVLRDVAAAEMEGEIRAKI